MKRPIKILWVFFLFDILATFLFHFDLIMTDLLKIKLFEFFFLVGTET